MKLRLNKTFRELAFFFGLTVSTVSEVFRTWISFLFYQLKELKIWQSRKVVDLHMPADFKKKFPSTRVIIDGTEVPIDKPGNVRDQCATWSSYKNRNTLKVLVGTVTMQ